MITRRLFMLFGAAITVFRGARPAKAALPQPAVPEPELTQCMECGGWHGGPLTLGPAWSQAEIDDFTRRWEALVSNPGEVYIHGQGQDTNIDRHA
jgi:hypothetical protein